MLYVLLLCPGVLAEDDYEVHDITISGYIIYTLISLLLVLFSGLMSGLTVGLMGLDSNDLQLKEAFGSQREQQQAKALIPIITEHHYLLVTLLVSNALAMEALPIFLDAMFGGILAVILSTFFIFVFGEVVPMSILTGPNQLALCAKAVPIVKVLMKIM